MNAAVAMIDPDTPELEVASTLLGTVVVPENHVFEFDRGLLGFPEAKGFVLIPTNQDGMFWLQSTDFEALTFLVVDPFEYVDGYSVEMGTSELGHLAPEQASELLVLTILTLPREQGDDATANLQGPLALNLAQRRGRQIVLQDCPYTVRHPVALPVTAGG